MTDQPSRVLTSTVRCAAPLSCQNAPPFFTLGNANALFATLVVSRGSMALRFAKHTEQLQAHILIRQWKGAMRLLTLLLDTLLDVEAVAINDIIGRMRFLKVLGQYLM